MATSTVTVGAFTGFATGANSVVSVALSNTPVDFATMNTLAMTAGVAWTSSAGDDFLTLNIRIVNGATILAAADGTGTYEELEPEWETTTTSGTTNSVSFTYVNLTADQATWDGASVEVQQIYRSNMKNDGENVTNVATMTFNIDYDIAVASSTGTMAANESTTPDVFAGSGEVPVDGTLAGTESAALDTAAATGTVAVDGTLAAAETGPDIAAVSGTVAVDGSMAAAEAVTLDVFAASGTVTDPSILGTMAVTETGADTAAATGTVPVDGSMAAAEAATLDVFAATGELPLSGTMAATETGADIAAATGTVAVDGTMAVNEIGADTAAATGTVAVDGSMAAAEAVTLDVFAAAGTVTDPGIVGNMAAAEATTLDVFAATGELPLSGTMAVTETGLDIAAATGTVAVDGTLAAAETGPDIAAVSGTVAVDGSMAAAEAATLDVFAGTGSLATDATGTMAATETGADVAAVTGTVALSGTVAAAETGTDTATITGSVPVSGSMATTDDATLDTFAASGVVAFAPREGTMAATETGDDTWASTAELPVTGFVDAIEPELDAAVFTGGVEVSGTMVTTDDPYYVDVAEGEIKVTVTASISLFEGGADDFGATGAVFDPVTGTMAATESGGDTATGVGVTLTIDGTATLIEYGLDKADMAFTVPTPIAPYGFAPRPGKTPTYNTQNINDLVRLAEGNEKPRRDTYQWSTGARDADRVRDV